MTSEEQNVRALPGVRGPGIRLPLSVSAVLIGLTSVLGAAQDPPPVPVEGPMTAWVAAMETDSNVGRRLALEAALGESGIPYEVEAFSIEPRRDYPRTEGANLVVTIGDGPSDIVIGAHYDAVWLSEGVLSRGAVDNAASAVVLVRLARALREADLQHRIRIVLFDMEEIGLIGSRRFLEAHSDDAIGAGVNLDVNGYGDTVFYGPSAASGNEPLYALMEDHCVREDLECLESPAYPNSDHRNFQAAGVPNISFSLFPAIEAHQLWLYLNGGREAFSPQFAPRVFQTIHTPADTSDMVEEAALELAFRSLEGFVLRLDLTLGR